MAQHPQQPQELMSRRRALGIIAATTFGVVSSLGSLIYVSSRGSKSETGGPGETPLDYGAGEPDYLTMQKIGSDKTFGQFRRYLTENNYRFSVIGDDVDIRQLLERASMRDDIWTNATRFVAGSSDATAIETYHPVKNDLFIYDASAGDSANVLFALDLNE